MYIIMYNYIHVYYVHGFKVHTHTMGCYLCQNDYDNVHTRAFICALQHVHMHITYAHYNTLQYACQHAYARYNNHACYVD